MGIGPNGYYYAIYRVQYSDGKWEESHRLDWPHNGEFIFNWHMLQTIVSEPVVSRIQVKLYRKPHWADETVPVYGPEHYIETWDFSRDEWIDRIAENPVLVGTSSWVIEYEGEARWELYRHGSELRGFAAHLLLPDIVKAVVLVQGYCTQCQQLRPMEMVRRRSECGPCMARGHGYRIVDSEADRLWRIELWSRAYEQFNYTEEEIAGIPSWINLHNPPVGWDEEVISDE